MKQMIAQEGKQSGEERNLFIVGGSAIWYSHVEVSVQVPQETVVN